MIQHNDTTYSVEECMMLLRQDLEQEIDMMLTARRYMQKHPEEDFSLV